ncbi:MAG: hypothetical protein P0Y50_13810 [Candidatus Brevundimonas colombiensis]|uniref:Uncharacterized protein n=1 Tax=Candidatus Brevundimonas colombiensis TaxID=3121376 RepID=A0AAJ5WY67_9CAUL|nr:hypothetical protein [Brevundimonas sp.]WEK39594.1 MAG: hypothetical protein P0Y50_13810 [Brevundimonas sp.]
MSIHEKKAEFNLNVWDHASDVFQMQFDMRRELDSNEAALLEKVAAAVVEPDIDIASTNLQRVLVKEKKSTDPMAMILQLSGLTRSKITGDLKAAAQASGKSLRIPSSYKSLVGSPAWVVAGPYLVTRLRTVLGPLSRMPLTFEDAAEALNQATWPGYIRQERAKRSGHEAESRLATLLRNLELPFAPEAKADNPMCPDIILGGVSFDLIVPSKEKPRMVVKSTVHTSNIGQFGESKDSLEMMEARTWINSLKDTKKPILLAFIDGIGFRSNKAGLEGVLDGSDEFCQFKSIWKAAVVASGVIGRKVEVYLPKATIASQSAFLERWKSTTDVHELTDAHSTADMVLAGEGYVQVPS